MPTTDQTPNGAPTAPAITADRLYERSTQSKCFNLDECAVLRELAARFVTHVEDCEPITENDFDELTAHVASDVFDTRLIHVEDEFAACLKLGVAHLELAALDVAGTSDTTTVADVMRAGLFDRLYELSAQLADAYADLEHEQHEAEMRAKHGSRDVSAGLTPLRLQSHGVKAL